MTQARLRVLALVPAHDEGPRIGRVVIEAARHLPVLVVDDGSDDTAQTAQRAGARVIRQRPNRGKRAALRTGFADALERGFDATTLDGDGQRRARSAAAGGTDPRRPE